MLTDEKVKSGFHAWYMLCPLRHTLILVSALVIFFHLLTRPFRALNVWLSEHVTRPAHLWLSVQSGKVPFSLAELLIALLVISWWSIWSPSLSISSVGPSSSSVSTAR